MTLHLSRLILNPRSRQVRTDLASPYEMHRTLMAAFPSREQGGPGRVLFRIEETGGGGLPTVLVQSEKEPDWSCWAEREEYLIGTDVDNPAVKPFTLTLLPRQRLRFRLRANPTFKREGKRMGHMREEAQIAWLHRKGEASGFKVLGCQVLPKGHGPVGRIKEDDKAKTITMLAVLFEGVLEVTDPERFAKAIREGIGSGKGMGFGLMSVAPYRGDPA